MNLESLGSSSCSSQWVQMMLIGVEEIVGPEDISRIVALMSQDGEDGCGSLNSLPSVHAALQEMYGMRGGQGVALRAGQSAYKTLLRRQGMQMGLFSNQFRLLPTHARIRLGLEALAEQISLLWNEKVTIAEDGRYWIWRTEHCPLCADLHTAYPSCYFTIGFLQGFLSWTAGGKNYLVAETECVAMGHPACVLMIDQRAVEG
ncbi:MAG TPA: 4-vinyl reductase [Anaerolineaceae bacterium]|nr:4-vinyl reductase [Anaerolineaceae bacterium]